MLSWPDRSYTGLSKNLANSDEYWQTKKKERIISGFFRLTDYKDNNLFSVSSYNFTFYLMLSTDCAKSTMSKMKRNVLYHVLV